MTTACSMLSVRPVSRSRNAPIIINRSITSARIHARILFSLSIPCPAFSSSLQVMFLIFPVFRQFENLRGISFPIQQNSLPEIPAGCKFVFI